MRSVALAPTGGSGGAVRVDETFIGNDRTKKPHGEKKGRAHAPKHEMLTLADRETKRAENIIVDDLKKSALISILREYRRRGRGLH